jgi:hypothetical protein
MYIDEGTNKLLKIKSNQINAIAGFQLRTMPRTMQSTARLPKLQVMFACTKALSNILHHLQREVSVNIVYL